MDLKYYTSYLTFHASLHLFFVILIYLLLRLDFVQLLLVLLASAAVDLDHLPFIRKKGVKYWVKVWGNHIIKSYPLHNFTMIVIFSIGSLFAFDQQLFLIGICSLSAALHLIWDLIEDVLIFRMGFRHWSI
jgi:hypothetical protein